MAGPLRFEPSMIICSAIGKFPGWCVPSITRKESSTAGSGVFGVMVYGPAPGISNTILSGPALVLAASRASRRLQWPALQLPSLLSSIVLTCQTACPNPRVVSIRNKAEIPAFCHLSIHHFPNMAAKVIALLNNCLRQALLSCEGEVQR